MHIDKRLAFLLMASMVILGIFVSSTETAFAQAPVVSVGTASGSAGTAVDLTVSFTAGATGVSTLQFDLTFPSSLTYVSTTTGAAATAAGKSASGNALSGGARVLVFSLGTTSIGSGAVAVVRLNIAGGTSPGSIPVGITGIVAADAASNAVTANGSGGSVTVAAPADTTAPVISAATASGMSATGATISWTTNEAADTQVDYGTTTAYGSSTTLKDTSPRVSSHSQALSGLQASTLYHYRVKSKDAAGNLATSGDFSFTTTAAPDTTAPVISAVTASGMSATGATISWTTNEASDTQVDYGTTTAYGSSTTLKDASPRVSSHSQALSGLQASTLYHYRVKSKDAAGNLATSGDFSFTTTAAPDTTAPVISAVTASGMSATGATISWTTNEASDTQVDYGTTTAYGSSTTINGSMVTGHSQGLSGLTASTTYNYRVRSKDAAGNQAVSGNFTFATTAAPDTTAPVISAVTASGMSATGATISWTTNEASDTQVDYGTTTAYGSSTTINGSMVTGHSQGLSGLQASKLYHYRVKSKDAAGNLATSGDFSFTTTAAPDTTAPVISAVTASGMSATGATISWTTNEASDTQVDYGTTTAYGSSTTINGSMVTGHSQGLSGLTASTTYNYRVRSKDAAGNQAVSGNFTFATTAAPDTTAPVISAVTASGMSATGATISWTTNEASDTQVDYGTTTAYGSSTTINGSMVTGHSQGLSGLTASTTYNYRVRSKDAAGNQAVSGNFTFTTTAAPDTTAPVISAVTASGMSATGATISWTTNEASDTQVDYGTTTAYGSSTTLKDTSPRVSSHSQALSGLQASTLYHYRVKSKDAAGNLATSGDFSFTTTAAPDTTAPVISAVTASGMSATGATISWTTNEASDTQVDYGTTTAYGSSTTINGSMVTGHSQGLSGLTASTTYNYRVRSKDAAGNQAVSGNFTFATTATADTTAPVISAIQVTNVTTSTVDISWTTNEASDTQVEYGTAATYGSSTTINTTQLASHLQSLSGLAPDTLYHYRVKSKDAAGNLATSGDLTYTTSSVLPPPTNVSVK